MTKALKQSAKVRTNATPNSICKIQIEAVKFSALWSSYPKTGTPYLDAKGKVPPGYENQCDLPPAAIPINWREVQGVAG